MSGERQPVIAIIGSGASLSHPDIETMAEDVGMLAVDAGFRVATGGLGGVMAAASRGARRSARKHDGSVIAIIPSYDRNTATMYADIVIATGQQIARNVILVASSDVVVAIGGGAGTLSEIAIAWQLAKPVIALSDTGGWAEALAGHQIDRRQDTVVHAVASASAAIERALAMTAHDHGEPGAIASGWKTRPGRGQTS